MMKSLFLPEYYRNLPTGDKTSICNGCGPKSWKCEFIPQTIWGLSIKECCNIHDAGYYFGKTIQDKEEADRIFLNNMLRVIDSQSQWWFLKKIRRNRARAYYYAVHWFGGPAFWANKNS